MLLISINLLILRIYLYIASLIKIVQNVALKKVLAAVLSVYLIWASKITVSVSEKGLSYRRSLVPYFFQTISSKIIWIDILQRWIFNFLILKNSDWWIIEAEHSLHPKWTLRISM